MRKFGYFLALLIGVTVTPPSQATAPSQATCAAYLANNPNPAGIPSVSGPGVAQRSAFLADSGKLVAIGSRYYSVSIPPKFYTATTPVVVFDLHGTGGYPEAEWNDWHASMADRGYAFISLSWGGGTPSAATDTEIYTQLKQIYQDVGAYCPITNARKWLMGFSVGSAMSFAVMIHDVAGQKIFRGQIAVSGAAIGPLTTGKDVMHSTVEANRTNVNAMLGVESWMYCGEMDLDHGWSMCTEMPNGESFVNDHGGQAVLYKDPSGEHHSLPTNTTARNAMLDYLASTSDGEWVIEFYNTALDHYFITANSSEAAAIDGGSAGSGWSRTGHNFKSGGSSQVCRFYGSQSPGPNSHFYTADAEECSYLKQLEATTPATEKRWNFESMDFSTTAPTNSICPDGTTPIYRAYNNGFARSIDSNHRITSNTTALQEVAARGWNNESVVMCSPL
ncbi:MAG: hypothetical protein WC091_23695 [Sulfuricellaceae bacterium]